MSLQIELGKSYRDYEGRVHGPMTEARGGCIGCRESGSLCWWYKNTGLITDYSKSVGADLVEVVDTPANDDPKVEVGGLVNSKVPPYHLIPPVVFRVLASRFEKGVQRKGDKAWNAQSKDQSPLRDHAALLERLNHLQNHLLRLQEDLAAGKSVDLAEDPAAILWGGAFVVASIDAISRKGEWC